MGIKLPMPPGYEDDPLFQSINYVWEMRGFNAIFLKTHELNRSQLQDVTPAIRQILKEYQHRKPFSEVSSVVKGDYRSEAKLEKKRRDIDGINFGLVQDYLLNAAKVIGPERIEEALRKTPVEQSGEVSLAALKKKVSYHAAIFMLASFLSKSDSLDKLTPGHIEYITMAVDTADELLREPPKA